MPHHHHLTDWLDHLRRAGRSATTIETYRITLQRAAAQLPYGLLATTDELATWIARVPGRNTRASYAVALRGFYRWCVRTGRITADPTAELAAATHQRGLPRPVQHDELAMLLTRARDPYRLWCLLAAYAGLRCCEIARLDRCDVTEQAVTVLRGKGDRPRVVPTHPQLWAALVGHPAGPVAGGRSARRVSTGIARECDRVGLPAVTAHRLRHWAGTWWQAATGDVRVTQELLGHASPTTTAIYTAVSDQSRKRAVLALPALTAAR